MATLIEGKLISLEIPYSGPFYSGPPLPIAIRIQGKQTMMARPG